jgi:hypothetical protein
MSRKFLIPLLTAVFLAAPAFGPATMTSLSDSALAQKTPTTPTTNSSNLNLSKSNVNRTEQTGKTGGKPTKDQRTGGSTKNSGHAMEKTTNFNSSKSNKTK